MVVLTPAHTQFTGREMLAEVPLAGLSFVTFCGT
jgi:hypothetical protein